MSIKRITPKRIVRRPAGNVRFTAPATRAILGKKAKARKTGKPTKQF
jgi:hypothetical protein